MQNSQKLKIPAAVTVGKFWEFDYSRLLYQGGASANIKLPTECLSEKLGVIDERRLPLVQRIADVIASRIRAGGSQLSGKTVIDKVRVFYTWADQRNLILTVENVARNFLQWSDYLASRARNGEIKESTAYGVVAIISGLLDEVLGLETGLIRQTRHRRKARGNFAKFRPIDLEQTSLLGHTLCDICNALSAETIRQDLPINIFFRSGRIVRHWSGLRGIEVRTDLSDAKEGPLRKTLNIGQDVSNYNRRSLINLRIQAELLIFIAQTGMNLAQARSLNAGQFSYRSHLDGYLISRVYKPRKKGAVEFEIFAEYRPFFERYLGWLKDVFPNSEQTQLFPFIASRSTQGRSLNGVCENLKGIRSLLRKLDTDFLTPRQLRKARINWLARRSGDIDQTSVMAQTSREVLLKNYLQPDPQIAAAEISQFFQKQEESAHSPPGPGLCVEPVPSPLLNSPPGAPKPDCVSPSGCMFCSHQRDIDSPDHVWSLVTYRHLKILELVTYRPMSKIMQHPTSAVIDKVSQKIEVFEKIDKIRKKWVEEARERIKESEYHPMWAGFIDLLEVLL